MNLLNLCTSCRRPLSMSCVTHSGASSSSFRLSFTSSTAWGNFVISVRGTGSPGSLNHRPDSRHVSPCSGFSLIIHKFVSSDTRTVASKGIWNATRMYCVLISGCSCLTSTTFCTSWKSSLNLAISSSDLPCCLSTSLASSTVYCPFRNGITVSGGSVKRSFTEISPFQLSLWVFRSMKASSGSPSPYHRMRSAMAWGRFSSRPWYISSCELSK
mmetsp:Transcript_2552/g.5966  ORF Transcript_2552/g.5966 Transcript_2552/m.5966 type:complete len:214 (-) Transcript_2552:877-1518(-)